VPVVGVIPVDLSLEDATTAQTCGLLALLFEQKATKKR
jgi:hypothetical protein